MKTKLLLLLGLVSLQSVLAFECQEVNRIHKSRRLDCQVETRKGLKIFHILELRGSFTETAFDHGYLLSNEARAGVLKEVEERFQRGLHEGGFAARQMKAAIVDCYLSRMKASVSSEFLNAIQQMTNGLTSGATSGEPFTQTQMERSAFGVELSIATEGLQRNIEIDPVGTYAELGASCGITMSLESLDTFLDVIGHFIPFKLGCLGMVAPASATVDGAMMHARNLDGDLAESWNTAPTLFLFDEPGHYRFAATATAGMLFPGGISGFNERGIAVSIHEMSTHKYRTLALSGNAAVAPFLQQRILREAATLDEAIQLIESTKFFGGWTFLVSDSKTNEVASIEVSGQNVQVARRRVNQTMGQSNHFLGTEMQDQYFTYNFNKQLESISRLQVAEADLSKDFGNIDLTWFINHLAGHIDAFEGFRSFGRTATKVYTLMSTIAIPNRNQFWVTSGDRIPASHSPFLGFQIDWNSLSATPIAQERVKLYDALPHWEESLEVYGQARVAFEKDNPAESIHLLSKAIELAEQDGKREWPYYFMRARVSLTAHLSPANGVQDLEFVWANRGQLHEYQQALIALYSSAANSQLSARDRQARLNFARAKFQKLQNQFHHFDLAKKLDYLSKIEKGAKNPKAPALDFVTVQ